MDQTSFENSKTTLNKNGKESLKGTKTKHFFNVEDLEDDDITFPNDSTVSKNQSGHQEVESPRRASARANKKKSARVSRLEPLKAADPKTIDISHKKQASNRSEQEEEEDDIEDIVITRNTKKNKEQKKMLVFDEDDEEISDKQDNPNMNKQKKPEESFPNKNKISHHPGNSSDEEHHAQQNQQRPEPKVIVVSDEEAEQPQGGVHNILTMINPEDQMSFVVRRDKEWLGKLRPQFNIHHLSNNEFYFSAKMTSSNTSSTMIVSANKNDFTENGPHYIGKLKGNFTGSEFNIFGPGYNPSDAKQKKLPLRRLLATIEYETNFFGSARPRNFKVYLLKPGISYYEQLLGTKKFSDEISLSELYQKPANKDKIVVFTNKKPEWNEEIQGYMLNFGGKVKKASIKNFILEDEENSENNRMVFGKIADDEFRMDIGFPLSPFLATGICLSAFGSKIGCE